MLAITWVGALRLSLAAIGVGVCLAVFSGSVQASAPSTAVFSIVNADVVQIRASGDANSLVQLMFFPSGYSAASTLSLGTTDTNGNLVTTISSGAYGIAPGVTVAILVNGQQSTNVAWPAYRSALTLSTSNVQLNVGQSVTITTSNPVAVMANSNRSAVFTVVNGNQVTFVGQAAGFATATVCASGLGCNNVTVSVGGVASTVLTLSQNSVTLKPGQSAEVTINYNGPGDGFVVSGNTNQSVVVATISGQSKVVTLYGGSTPGTSTVTVCSTFSSGSCAALTVTTTIPGSTAGSVYFSQNALSLNANQSVAVTAYGDPNNRYFLSSNSYPAAVNVGVNGNLIVFTAGSNSGLATVVICASSLSNVCGTVNVTNGSSSGQSNTALYFSQNNISISNGQALSVVVYGGSGSNYFISSNSNSSAVAASISGSALYLVGGTVTGSAVVSVCSAAASSVCSTVYVSNTGYGTNTNWSGMLYFSQNSVSLNIGQPVNITLYGFNAGTSYTVSNSNTNVVVTSISGNTLVLSGSRSAGSATVTVCVAGSSTNCGNIYVTVQSYLSNLTIGQSNITLSPKQTVSTLMYYSNSGGFISNFNSNSDVVTARVDGKSLVLLGGNMAGSAVVSVCSVAVSGDCANVWVTNDGNTSSQPSGSTAIVLSRSSVALTLGQNQSVVIYGNNPNDSYVAMGGNYAAVVGVEISGSTLQLTPRSIGSTTLSVCVRSNVHNCTLLEVRVGAAPVADPLHIPVNYKFTRNLAVRSLGTDVRELQKRLTSEKVYAGPVTGKFGAQTWAAVKKYQKNHGLRITGVVDVATRAVLNK